MADSGEDRFKDMGAEMMVEKQAHKHEMAVKYELEVLAKLGKRRWIIIDYCKNCEYQSARDTTYEKPPLKINKNN